MADKHKGEPKQAKPVQASGRTPGRKAATGEARSFDPRPRAGAASSATDRPETPPPAGKDLLGPAGDPAEGKR
jgi:hypothetical protein